MTRFPQRRLSAAAPAGFTPAGVLDEVKSRSEDAKRVFRSEGSPLAAPAGFTPPDALDEAKSRSEDAKRVFRSEGSPLPPRRDSLPPTRSMKRRAGARTPTHFPQRRLSPATSAGFTPAEVLDEVKSRSEDAKRVFRSEGSPLSRRRDSLPPTRLMKLKP